MALPEILEPLLSDGLLLVVVLDLLILDEDFFKKDSYYSLKHFSKVNSFKLSSNSIYLIYSKFSVKIKSPGVFFGNINLDSNLDLT